jgi:hypothetical protein
MGFCYENIWNCQIYKLIGTMSPVFNGVLLSSKDHPFWKDWLDFLIKNYRENKIVLRYYTLSNCSNFLAQLDQVHLESLLEKRDTNTPIQNGKQF